MAYNEVWDPNVPQASEARSLGDDRIREMKRAMDERFQTILDWPTANPLTFKAGVVAGTALQDASIPSGKLANGSILEAKLADGAVSLRTFGTDAAKAVPKMTVYDAAVGASTNHAGTNVVVGADTTIQYNFAGVPFKKASSGSIVGLPSIRGSVVTMSIIPAATQVPDDLALLFWTLVLNPFGAEQSLTVFGSRVVGTGNVTIDKNTVFRFGIFDLLDNTI